MHGMPIASYFTKDTMNLEFEMLLDSISHLNKTKMSTYQITKRALTTES